MRACYESYILYVPDAGQIASGPEMDDMTNSQNIPQGPLLGTGAQPTLGAGGVYHPADQSNDVANAFKGRFAIRGNPGDERGEEPNPTNTDAVAAIRGGPTTVSGNVGGGAPGGGDPGSGTGIINDCYKPTFLAAVGTVMGLGLLTS